MAFRERDEEDEGPTLGGGNFDRNFSLAPRFAGAHVVAADGSFLRVAGAPAIQMAADSVILEADGDPWRWTREVQPTVPLSFTV